MPDCEHCGESFDDEGAYLDHLGEEHWDDLGRIDRRRVESHRDGDGGLSRGTLAIGALVVFVLAVLVFVTVFLNDGGEDRLETEPLPDRGDEAVLQRVASEPGHSRDHVPAGTDVDYEPSPPTGGPHYNDWVDGGFYEESPPLGELVHSLEHGAVIVWYEPEAMTPEAMASLRAWGHAHQRNYGSIIAVPTPVEDPESPYVLTAWERRLPMDGYDAETVRQFAAEYLGRGPERQIR